LWFFTEELEFYLEEMSASDCYSDADSVQNDQNWRCSDKDTSSDDDETPILSIRMKSIYKHDDDDKNLSSIAEETEQDESNAQETPIPKQIVSKVSKVRPKTLKQMCLDYNLKRSQMHTLRSAGDLDRYIMFRKITLLDSFIPWTKPKILIEQV